MLLDLAPEWTIDLDRGPDWLFLRLRPPSKSVGGNAAGAQPAGSITVPLAEKVFQRLEQAFCYRVVLELDEVPLLRSWMLGELVRLHKRVTTQGGTLRLCGLSAASEEALTACGLFEHFPTFANRHDAVMGHRPTQPR